MADDLEDFLRRAAEKRREALRAVREEAARETHSHTAATERVTVIEPELGIEVLDDIPVARPVDVSPPVTPKVLPPRTPVASMTDERHTVATPAASDLVRRLRQPGGLRDAILVREILERPQHRW